MNISKSTIAMFQRQLENLIVDLHRVKLPNGVAFLLNLNPLIEASHGVVEMMQEVLERFNSGDFGYTLKGD